MTQRIIEVYVPLGKTPEGETAFFAQFKGARCSVCEGAGVAMENEPACGHCGGTGREPGER